jgi:hypothetical protein
MMSIWEIGVEESQVSKVKQEDEICGGQKVKILGSCPFKRRQIIKPGIIVHCYSLPRQRMNRSKKRKIDFTTTDAVVPYGRAVDSYEIEALLSRLTLRLRAAVSSVLNAVRSYLRQLKTFLVFSA